MHGRDVGQKIPLSRVGNSCSRSMLHTGQSHFSRYSAWHSNNVPFPIRADETENGSNFALCSQRAERSSCLAFQAQVTAVANCKVWPVSHFREVADEIFASVD